MTQRTEVMEIASSNIGTKTETGSIKPSNTEINALIKKSKSRRSQGPITALGSSFQSAASAIWQSIRTVGSRIGASIGARIVSPKVGFDHLAIRLRYRNHSGTRSIQLLQLSQGYGEISGTLLCWDYDE